MRIINASLPKSHWGRCDELKKLNNGCLANRVKNQAFHSQMEATRQMGKIPYA